MTAQMPSWMRRQKNLVEMPFLASKKLSNAGGPKRSSLAQAAAELGGQDEAEFQVIKKKVVITQEQKARENALKGYEDAMTKIGHKLLASGLDMGLVADICTEPEDKSKRSPKAKHQPRPELPAAPGEVPRIPLRALADEAKPEPSQPRVMLDPVVQEGSALFSKDEQTYAWVSKCHKIQEEMEKAARHPPEPPQAVIRAGGHLLLCIVSSTSSETNTEVAVGDFGPPMGISHFIQPLRQKGLGQAHPTLVVLAEELPRDWHSVADDDNIFFVAGSALSVVDLDRAGFRKANAIAVNRCHQPAYKRKDAKIADARAILVTTIIEAQFTNRAPPPVITDLAYDASVDFLPQSHAMMLAMQTISARPPKRAGGAGTDYMDLPLLTGHKQVTSSEIIAKQTRLAEESFEEDYEVLETPDYAEHPRFMCGMVFVASAMTTLVANTVHNHSLVHLVANLLDSPFLLLHVPFVWQGQCYADLCEWLMKARNLLALGIYRNSQPAGEGADGGRKPSLYYMYTAPPAYRTTVNRSDRILVICPAM